MSQRKHKRRIYSVMPYRRLRGSTVFVLTYIA